MKIHVFEQPPEVQILYLCDGKACSEEQKKNCFMQDPKNREPNRLTGKLDEPCRHTSDIAHAVNFRKFAEASNAYIEEEKR